MRLISALLLIAIFTIAEIAAAGSTETRVVQASEIATKIEKGEPVDYSYVTINGDLNLNGINISKARYLKSSINISDSIISGFVNLDNTILQKSVNFERTEFMRPASFIGTKFNGDIHFDGSRFDDDSLFISSEFNNFANFQYTKFNGFANFLGAKFNCEQDFHNCLFNDTASFKFVVFRYNSNFEETKFMRSANFIGAQFGSARFAGAQFKGLSDFGSAQFNQSVDFVGTEFINMIYLTDVKFSKLLVVWDSVKDKLVCDGPTYLLLIKNFKDMEQFADADNCYYQYREVTRKERYDLWGKLLDYISWLSCGYGVRWQHPILSGIMIAILFGLYYESNSLRRKAANFFHKQDGKNPCKHDFIDNFKKSLSFSVMMLLSLPPEWSRFGREEYVKFVTHHWFSGILERLIGWGLMLLLIGTLTRLMVRY